MPPRRSEVHAVVEAAEQRANEAREENDNMKTRIKELIDTTVAEKRSCIFVLLQGLQELLDQFF